MSKPRTPKAVATLATAGPPTQQFAYDAVSDSPRRRALPTAINSETWHQIRRNAHARIGEGIADQRRNTELVGWMIRTHVAYVSQFRPHIATKVRDLNAELARLFEWHAHKRRFDVAKRHGRDAFLALFEATKLTDGDAAAVWLPGGNAQLVPGRRIAKPGPLLTDALANPDGITDRGLVLDSYGAVLQYCVCRWNATGTALEFDHLEPAENVSFCGASWIDADQTRGMSPLSAALNRVRDSMTAMEFTGLKIVLHSLLGFAFKSPTGRGPFPDQPNGEPTARKVDVADGLFNLELLDTESVDMLESKIPSSEFEPFQRLAIRLIMLALDIPYVLFDSKNASYSEHRAALNSYEFMAEQKRAGNRELLDDYADRRLDAWLGGTDPIGYRARAIMEGAGLTVAEVKYNTEWVPVSTPWLDKGKEVAADVAAIAAGIDSIPRVCRRHNVDPYDIVDENAPILAYAKAKGAPIYLGQPGQTTVEEAAVDSTPPPAQEPAV